MAIYYHVSTYLRHNGMFTPRIPNYRHKQQEDITTPRVCVGSSIEDCLTAIPGGGSNLDVLNIEQRGYFLIFRIDTDKLGIPEESIVASDELFQKDLVRDAELTNETWITCGFHVPLEDRQIIKLNDWSEEIYDVIPNYIYEKADKNYEGDYLRCYMEEMNEYVPSSIRITNAEYSTGILKKDEYLYYEKLDNLETQWLEEQSINFPIDVIEDDFSLEIIARECCDISAIFKTHVEVISTLSEIGA